MVQVPIKIPALSPSPSPLYMACLFCCLYIFLKFSGAIIFASLSAFQNPGEAFRKASPGLCDYLLVNFPFLRNCSSFIPSANSGIAFGSFMLLFRQTKNTL
ncbi:hypothetical protein ED312_14060 [Sinomicrobium pectinilyticum]|uniref:Uncharacterized protein n=1 Tax=Sinomicrobium pectinilyticum TaxID=1084421 RepID=A0A3N0E890_SINP1|nr:hypothetical protein ED312_14060 [Sinomicrobium pectinilyticum]